MATVEHRIEREEGVARLAFEGQIDLSNGKEVRAVILRALAEASDIRVDLDAISYIDSSGIAHLVEGFQRARKAGKSFTVVAASEQVRRVLRISRLDTVLLA